MSKKKKEIKEEIEEEFDNEEEVVVFENEDGTEDYFIKEMELSVGDARFALLVPAYTDEEEGEHHHEHEHEHDCECGCCHEHEEETAFFAKVIEHENGEREFVIPTDEEFEAACDAYEELMDELEKDLE